ncbi:MAG: DUF6503 family protein [bacterium]
MKALVTRLKKFTLAVVPFYLLWTSPPFKLAQSETSREIIAAMISAHGGMEKWRAVPTVSFEDHFLPASGQKPTISQVTVEQGPRRAYLDFPESKSRIAWDGNKAWSENWQDPIPPRFVALLNYYFLNLPWLAMDPGVILGEPKKAKLWNDPTEYITVKMTFDAGVGDTPEDYYVLYIDPKSHRLKACEYIVTYAALLPPGVRATPPHILIYEEFATVDGLVVPTRYSIYEENHSLYASCEIRSWSFKKPFDATRMTMPPGAVIDSSSPTRVN